MKKLFTFFFALLASSCLWAEITYELNGGKFNDYEWKNKGEMFAAFMTDAGATEFETLDYYMQQTDPLGSPNICAKLEDASPALKMSKWAWLKAYVEKAHTDQAADGASALPADGKGSAWRYAVGAFFISGQRATWPKSADFSELGKDAAYLPAWGQNYGNPTNPTEEVTLVNPHRTGYIFDGWYTTSDFSGAKVTTVDQNTTGTLYAKWTLDGIVYELNGGKFNDYGWTSKGDICLDFEADYNATYSVTKDWVKDDNGTIKYNIGGTWMTETEAKGQAANVGNFLNANTWSNDEKVLKLITTTKVDKYGWLKDLFMAIRGAQGVSTDMKDADYRLELSAFFLCSPALTLSTASCSSYETTGDYEDFQPYWGQSYLNPEHPTEEVTLYAPVKAGYKFDGWYDNASFTGSPITKVDQNTKGTLYAKWVLSGIVYELNGGQYNKYGWTSKEDMYNAFIADWKAYEGPDATDRVTVSYEDQLGIGKSNGGIPTTIGTEVLRNNLPAMFMHNNYSAKWGWLAKYLDAVASTQYKKMDAAQGEKTQPSTNGAVLAFSLGNFFGEDKNHTTDYIDAVDFTGAEAHISAFQSTWGQSFPNPKNPTETTTLNIAYKERHNFEGWYDNAECTGTPITTVDENYAGTLYAKWSVAPITYELNGGQYNQYGWKNKKDMYEDLNKDWNAFAKKDNTWPAYETVYGVGNSNNGVAGKTDAEFSTFFTDASYKDKWGWMLTYLDAIATKQGKTLPSTDPIPLRWGVGNFLCDDNNGSQTWHKAVDCTGEDGQLYTAQSYCSFTLPNPTYPTTEVTLNNPTREGYEFAGWYTNAECTGTPVTKVNADTKGTLYAKWTEIYTRNVTSGNYGTICLPYGSTNYTGAVLYEVVGKEPGKVYLGSVTEIEAGVPYIFQATASQIKVVYEGAKVSEAGSANGLVGTFDNNTTVSIGNYILYENKFCLAAGVCYVNANRAYLDMDAISGGKPSSIPGRKYIGMDVQGENEATGVDNIISTEVPVKVIENGQIIIIRNGEKYNLQGMKIME